MLHRRLLLPLLLLAALASLAGRCGSPDPRIVIQAPAPLEDTSACDVELRFEMRGAFTGAPEVFVNFAPLAQTLTTVSPGVYTAGLGTQDGLAPGSNMVLVRGLRASDGELLTQGVTFTWSPRARAYQISDPASLITGPLAHNRVGDFMLESCEARFAVQDGGQRDLYSVGQFGGNLIDAERIGRPGLDNFLEVQTMANVETVLNAQSVFVVNDGADGQAAVVRACGPDDLLDFVNPSSQVSDAGIPFPPALNDNDQTVEGCTDYALEATNSHVSMTTTFTNTGPDAITMMAGDWMNSAGELDTVGVPGKGVGPALFDVTGSLGFFGFDDARGVDYAYTSLPATPGSYVVISGVTVILHDKQVIQALVGLETGTTVLPGETYVLRRFFGVGDGSGSNSVDLAAAVKGTATGRVEGCVTVGGAPAPGAVVTVGTFSPAGALTALATTFVTDEAGCYSGLVPTPNAPTSYGAVAAREGALYQGGAPTPPVTAFAISTGQTATLDFALPATGSLSVTTTTPGGAPLPARVSVVGFDPSPPITQAGPSLPGFGGSTLGLFLDPDDSLPFGLVDSVHTGGDGQATFDLEPGSYEIFVSRGTEYSIASQPVTIVAGQQSQMTAALTQVLDTDGFVSSDFHIHGINSADSRVSHRKRAEGYAGEGVDNIIMTDHHVHTDLDPTIAALGLADWVSSTVGEEITTFDYGHFNAYPLAVDPSRVSGGSTDWAQAAPPGQDFPSSGAFNATPAEIHALATAGANSLPDTTIQVNHIDSHFEPLKIDTTLVPPSDGLDAVGRAERRLDEPVSTNLFFPFPALELWNGHTRGAQAEFLNERIGIWFNLLNQGIETTFIADTDSHRHDNLRMAGARTWTPAAPGSDAPGSVDGGEVAAMVDAGKATGGQGVFVTTVLRATDGSNDQADLTRAGSTHMSDAAGDVVLDIRVQAPAWSGFDTIEIYANAQTVPVDVAKPYLYSALPTQVLTEGDCDAATTGDGDFDVTVVDVSADPGAKRLEANLSVPFSGLTEDTWFVVLVKASDGACPALFPVFPANLSSTTNPTLADLIDGNVGETGVRALGATNALYFDYVAP